MDSAPPRLSPPNSWTSSVLVDRPLERPVVGGKFLFTEGGKLFVRGATYGTFRSVDSSDGYPAPRVVARDFASMAFNGFNAVRTYTVPPRWVLDTAHRCGLRVMVGIPWEQHVAFLDDREMARRIEGRVREGVHACLGHPAVLCYAIGNEIPPSIVRWHGARRTERFLERLLRVAREADPDGLFTYVNFPTTEYLDLPSLDLVSFNLYLEAQDRMDAYLARLQNVTGNRPLIMTEVGLDGRTHGEIVQARGIEWQLRTVFATGCAGAFIFSWTDEWSRGGYDAGEWAFGLTRRDRTPKPALSAARKAFAAVPLPKEVEWPRVSVVVCSRDGERTIGECLEACVALDYPDYEVIVVDDGSADRTAEIARRYEGVRLISTEPRGLGAARNTGMAAATGEIVAYIDDDAYPDIHWLSYLAWSFVTTEFVGVGGPNIPPPGDGLVADCVAQAPGGPIHVLLSDREAEHIPGCNMAFRREALESIGGFDPRFHAAGDDVDICWRLHQAGWKLGFNPGATVWHRRRNSIRAFWRQQRGYGKAEALLEEKWPEMYNSAGHHSWLGRIYGNGERHKRRSRRARIYQGMWGTAPFQFAAPSSQGFLASLVSMPEWHLLVGLLAVLSLLGTAWRPLLFAIPALIGAVATVLASAASVGARAPISPGVGFWGRIRRRTLTAALHFIQPVARLWGRIRYGLTPWRRHGFRGFAVPRIRSFVIWSERWRSGEERLLALEEYLRSIGAPVLRGGAYDYWDLKVGGGALGGARLRVAIEEHGRGRQLIRIRAYPDWTRVGLFPLGMAAGLSIAAFIDGSSVIGALMGAAATALAFLALRQNAAAMAAIISAVRNARAEP
jgi:GT2 family glycosyltransferase